MFIIKKVLFVATVVKKHIMVFHIPYLEWFQRKGYEVHVCAMNDYENEEECLIPYCDKFFNLPFERSPFKWNNIKVYNRLKEIIDYNDYDIIHCHTPMGGVLTRLSAQEVRKKGTKVIYTAHGFHFYKGAPLRNWLIYYPVERWLARFTDILITINIEDYGVAQKFKAKAVEYVPGVGVNVKKFRNVSVDREKKREELGIPTNTIAILSVGELSKRKNHEVIITALSKLKDHNILYLICGQGELEDYLKRKAKNLNVNVEFLGFRKDIDEICSVVDLYAFPSQQEGLPVALMEAMAAGLPVICSNVRGNCDLIENGKGGYLVETYNVDGYAEAIRKVIDKKEEMGSTNLYVINKFDINNVRSRMSEIYELLQ